jgi:peptidoglycan/xylan/chitin deacetylase (PgdA/CDA1 family)
MKQVLIGDDCRSERTSWCVGQRICVPESMYQRWLMRGCVVDGILLRCDAITLEDVNELRLLAAYTERQPLSARLPISYRWVPGVLRSWLAKKIGQQQRSRQNEWATFPRWPLDLSADALADLANEPNPWRESTTPVVLSHDLDSAEGVANLLRMFLTKEERYGARSTNFVVPCAWQLDHGQLREVQRRGHELGIHGYDHSNRTAFAEQRERQRRLSKGAELAQQYGMKGYRAPSLLRTKELLTDLASRYTYDSSIPTSGGLFPTPNNGCASARPFMIGDIIEVPLSLPRDGSLLFLGYSADEIADLWIACANRIAESGGVVVLLTHCEKRFSGNEIMLAAYERFLQHIAQADRFRWATMNEVVEEYRSRHLFSTSTEAMV